MESKKQALETRKAEYENGLAIAQKHGLENIVTLFTYELAAINADLAALEPKPAKMARHSYQHDTQYTVEAWSMQGHRICLAHFGKLEDAMQEVRSLKQDMLVETVWLNRSKAVAQKGCTYYVKNTMWARKSGKAIHSFSKHTY